MGRIGSPPDQAITGSKSKIVEKPLPPDDPKVRRPNIDLARKVLADWGPVISVEEGLERTREYFVSELQKGGQSEK